MIPIIFLTLLHTSLPTGSFKKLEKHMDNEVIIVEWTVEEESYWAR